MALESFYGGKQGISPVIKKSFWFVEDDLSNLDFFTYVLNKLKRIKINNNSLYGEINLPEFSSEKNTLDAWFNTQSASNQTITINGENVNIYESLRQLPDIQNIFNNIMNTQFAKGNEYTDVWYSEYCIIDSPSKSFKDNGKLFRRTLNSRNELNEASYAEYIGTLRGPAGQNPKINITSLNQLKTNFSLNKDGISDTNLFYPGKPSNELTELSFDITNEGISEDGDKILYSWYQIDNSEDETSTLELGFKIPAPQIEINDVKTVAWNKSSTVEASKSIDNPFLNKFNFYLSRGIKGTSVDNIRLKKINDFENLKLLLDFLEFENLKFFDNNYTNFISDFFDPTTEEDALDYFKNNFLYSFNNTVNLNLETGQATIDETENWRSYSKEKTDKKCWLHFLAKAIGEDSLIYTKISNLLTSFFDNTTEQRKEPSSLSIDEQDIITSIRELPILVYDAIFYDKQDYEEVPVTDTDFEVNNGNYTFFLCEYDNVKDINFDPSTNSLSFDFYYKNDINFENVIPFITNANYNTSNGYLTFEFNNGKSTSTQLNLIRELKIQNGQIYTSFFNDTTENSLNSNEDNFLKTYKIIKKLDGKIYAISSLINPDSDADIEETLLGETFDFSFNGILTSDNPPEQGNSVNWTGEEWQSYLNNNNNNYEDGLWMGTENLGGRGNWFYKINNNWEYMGNGLSSWPSFYEKTDIINRNNVDLRTQERTIGTIDSGNENMLNSTKKIIFGKLSVNLCIYDPFFNVVPKQDETFI